MLVKDFESPLIRVRNVASAGLLGGGELVLILRPTDLVAGAPPRGRVATPVSEAAEPEGPPWVLVVDDAVTTRAMERGLLELAGYQVKVAVDGLDAWTTLKSERFDLVVSDVDMPRMNGFELTQRIRADEAMAGPAGRAGVGARGARGQGARDRGRRQRLRREVELRAVQPARDHPPPRSSISDQSGLTAMIRVLLAEDSAVTRAYLTYLLSDDPGIEVIGAAKMARRRSN